MNSINSTLYKRKNYYFCFCSKTMSCLEMAFIHTLCYTRHHALDMTSEDRQENVKLFSVIFQMFTHFLKLFFTHDLQDVICFRRTYLTHGSSQILIEVAKMKELHWITLCMYVIGIFTAITYIKLYLFQAREFFFCIA